MVREPTSPDEIDGWIAEHVAAIDRFASVGLATAAHRLEHGCDAFEGAGGPFLGVLARVTGARRVLEVGTALGYSALWLADGSGAASEVHTIEKDELHAHLAREQFARHAVTNIEVLVGDDLSILAKLDRSYDLIFYDAAVPTLDHFDHFTRLLADRGVLVTSNLFLGRYAPDLPGLAEGARYREALFESPWLTSFANTKAITTRQA